MSPERPYEIFGYPSWPKAASLWGERALSEAVGRVYAGERTGLSRVKNLIQATKGICKKIDKG